MVDRLLRDSSIDSSFSDLANCLKLVDSTEFIVLNDNVR